MKLKAWRAGVFHKGSIKYLCLVAARGVSTLEIKPSVALQIIVELSVLYCCMQ